MSAIADGFVVTLNASNNFTVTTALNPPIYNKYYFRAIATQQCSIKASFARSAYSLSADGVLVQSNTILVGEHTFWHNCSDQALSVATITFLPTSTIAQRDDISIAFQFLTSFPAEYLYRH
jgi:hypothetical protein